MEPSSFSPDDGKELTGTHKKLVPVFEIVKLTVLVNRASVPSHRLGRQRRRQRLVQEIDVAEESGWTLTPLRQLLLRANAVVLVIAVTLLQGSP